MDKIIKKRLIGALPKIGIRPVVDGRVGGARENYESSVMELSYKIAELISENLKYPNGVKVECVVADRCIGGVAEACMCADKFSRENVGASITVSRSWCYGAETMDMDPMIPKAVWGTSASDVGGAVYLAAVSAAHDQKGLPAFKIFSSEIQDKEDVSIPDDVKQKLLDFASAGLAVAYMKGKSYLSVGGVSMGIAGSMLDHDFFQEYLGMRTEYVDMIEFIRRIESGIYDAEEYKTALEWTKKYCIEGEDDNPKEKQLNRQQKDVSWEISVKMALIMRDLMVGNNELGKLGYSEEALGHNALIAGFQGQRHWTDHLPVGDYMEAILNSSFDWTGIRQPYIVATENDNLNAVSMLFGNLLTGTAQIFADVRTYWSMESIKRVTGRELKGINTDGIMHLINSGPAALDGTGEQSIGDKPAIKPFYMIEEHEALKCLSATEWRPADSLSFMAGGYSTKWLAKGSMPVTLTRMNIVKGQGPVMQIAEGYTISLPEDINDILDKRTNPTWPTTWFVPNLTGKAPFTDVYSVMAKWGANHTSICYGHVGDRMITLASMLRIPVVMHNVEDSRIFRPASWDAFGTSDLSASDYNACRTYGPLYGIK